MVVRDRGGFSGFPAVASEARCSLSLQSLCPSAFLLPVYSPCTCVSSSSPPVTRSPVPVKLCSSQLRWSGGNTSGSARAKKSWQILEYNIEWERVEPSLQAPAVYRERKIETPCALMGACVECAGNTSQRLFPLLGMLCSYFPAWQPGVSFWRLLRRKPSPLPPPH